VEAQNRLIRECLKPEEITGDSQTRERRAAELVRWFARHADGNANPKWFKMHAYELAHYVAESKGL